MVLLEVWGDCAERLMKDRDTLIAQLSLIVFVIALMPILDAAMIYTGIADSWSSIIPTIALVIACMLISIKMWIDPKDNNDKSS